MYQRMNNENIEYLDSIIPCEKLQKELPLSDDLRVKINDHRTTIKNILSGKDSRKLAIVGPCSIHDYDSALDYAIQLSEIAEKVKDKIFIVMRTYFEKPRTTIGWKGFINDPDLDNSFNINRGLFLCRKLLIEINTLGLPVGCEFLNTITPQYFSELVSWGSIGARTVESQLHRQLASGLSMPVGFKNATSGDIQVALNAIESANHKHTFFGIDTENRAVRIRTKGNEYCHLILRGGCCSPNYEEQYINEIPKDTSIIIDCSHGNSQKNYLNQFSVLNYLLQKFVQDEYKNVIGFMLESNIYSGNQKMIPDQQEKESLEYGISITDSCISILDTEKILYNVFKRLP
jgi:3-deoxy-7-phosphoheptulonate synthase